MKLSKVVKNLFLVLAVLLILSDVADSLVGEGGRDERIRRRMRRRRLRERRRQRIQMLMQSDQPDLMLYQTFSSRRRADPTQATSRVSSTTASRTWNTFSPPQEMNSNGIEGPLRGDMNGDHNQMMDASSPVTLRPWQDIDDSDHPPVQSWTTKIPTNRAMTGMLNVNANVLATPSPAPPVPVYTPKDGELRLVDGRTENEGNVQVFHAGEWGSICDDEWDMSEAKIACKQMGFPGATGPTHSSQFGYALGKIWMDNMYCYGTEKNITDCRFDGWGIHDCDRTEAAGVRCHERLPPTTPPPPTTTPKPKTPISDKFNRQLDIRIAGGRVPEEGRVEVRLDGSNVWGTVCGDGWGVREAMVVCRELGMNFAQSAMQTYLFTPGAKIGDDGSLMGNITASDNAFKTNPILTGVSCQGNEESLYDCHHDADLFCPGTGAVDVAAVVCVEQQADLEPDIYELMSSAHLEDKQLFFLQCAMEENCLASEAYRLKRDRYDYATEMRRLLRFTTSIANIGNADFRPFIPKENWIWHGCHQHYHSMEVFAHFDVLDSTGQRVAEGHKASFCLEDNHCSGVDPKYDCENYGDQGITPGCKDIYYYNIDCQWLDVTELPLGTYTFRMAINPEYKVAEQTFENNAAICILVYSQQFATIRNCTLTRP